MLEKLDYLIDFASDNNVTITEVGLTMNQIHEIINYCEYADDMAMYRGIRIK